MSDELHFDLVVKGYAVLAETLIDKWSPYVQAVSGKAAAGTYQQADAASDFSAGMKLVAESMFAIGSEAFDAFAVVTSTYDETAWVGGYDTSESLSEVRFLAVKDDLKSQSGLTLPKARVSTEPGVLQPQCTHFETVVEGDGIKARTYDGVVVVTDAAGVVVDEVDVTVTVG